MNVIRAADEMAEIAASIISSGKRIGLVPTMGYLHDGHISLLKLIGDKCNVKIASIFVNPKQFDPSDDLDQYPRDEKRDLERLSKAGCDIVFIPTAENIYPEGYQTYIEVGDITHTLCGQYRPDHFRGVTTVVAKLFNITHCNIAAFGIKDYQQLKVIERMVHDLNLPVEILHGETLREHDGLAMSSRNRYLSTQARQTAARIPRALEWGRVQAESGEQNPSVIIEGVRHLLNEHDDVKIQYLEIVDPESLQAVEEIDQAALIALAVYVETIRLIDNILIGTNSKSKPIRGASV